MTPSLAANLVLPPAAILIVAGLLLPFTRGGLRAALILFAPILTLYLVWHLPVGQTATGLGTLVAVRGDALSLLFAILFSVMAFAAGLFGLRQRNTLELSAGMVCAGGGVGVALAGDLMTVFIFWMLMAVAAVLIVVSAGAYAVARRFAVIQILGAVLLMAGIAGEVATTGSLAFERMALDSIPRALMLAGFLIGAGGPPLSAWLADILPEVSWSGAIILSAFTGKAAIYVLLRGFPGVELLIYVGLIMAFYGIVYALQENDMRRLLAYALVNQLGIMIAGIGIGTETAINGVAAYSFVHTLYNALLFMAAGSVLLLTGKRNFTELGGLFRAMPLTMIFTIIGALSLSSFPLTAGFIATAMIPDAAASQQLEIVWYLLVAASAGAILIAGIRFPWLVFFHSDCGLRPPDPAPSMRLAMMLLSGLSIGIGITPAALYALLPYPMDGTPYAAGHLVAQLQIVMFASLAFALILRWRWDWLRPTQTIMLDTDWFYRKLGPALTRQLDRWASRLH